MSPSCSLLKHIHHRLPSPSQASGQEQEATATRLNQAKRQHRLTQHSHRNQFDENAYPSRRQNSEARKITLSRFDPELNKSEDCELGRGRSINGRLFPRSNPAAVPLMASTIRSRLPLYNMLASWHTVSSKKLPSRKRRWPCWKR